MATKSKIDVKLIVVVDKDDEGNTANLSFSKIALDAEDAALLTAAQGLGELQTRNVKEYKVNEFYSLSE
jgi:hypothetical protein